MRIAIPALVGMIVTFAGAVAAAQPAAPEAGPPGDAPPPPPSPGAAEATPAPPPPLTSVFPEGPAAAAIDNMPPLAGYHGGVFYLRDPKDYIRFYARFRMHLDFHSFFGPGIDELKAPDGGNALTPELALRRLRFEFGGELFKRWTFVGGVDFRASLSNANGKSESAAGKAGEDPSAESARFAAVQGASTGADVANVFINYSVAPWLNFMFGQHQMPFSMENRTSNRSISFMERNVAVRGFLTPLSKEIGLFVWGGGKVLNYELGVFAGDGQNRPQVDGKADFIGRVFVTPFGSKKGPLEGLQIGVSAKHGDRDPQYVGYDYASIKSNNGFTLWDPKYKDSLGRTTHIIPSGAQNAIGGELRVPISRFELRAEAYYQANNTREAVEGFQLTNTERLGQLRGTSWYVQVSAWPWGNPFVSGTPGISRPTTVDFSKPDHMKKGLEVAALVAAINASYDGASRSPEYYDAKTPGNPSGGVGSDITIYQYGLALNYFYSSHIRASVNYLLYHTPGSGTADNLAEVPGNEADVPDAHVLHELGARVGVQF